MNLDDSANAAIEQLRHMAADQVRAMTDDELALHADALCEMLAACKTEFDRRALEKCLPAGTA